MYLRIIYLCICWIIKCFNRHWCTVQTWRVVVAVLLYGIVSIVNAFDDIWRQELYYTIASVNAVHVSRSWQHWAVAVHSWRYVAVSNGFYFRQKWHRINPFRAKHRLQSTCLLRLRRWNSAKVVVNNMQRNGGHLNPRLPSTRRHLIPSPKD